MRRLLLAVALLIVIAGTPACSSSPEICEAVKGGQDPIAASGASYSAAGGPQKAEQAEKLRDAADEIRSSCPEQSNAAQRLESVAATLGA